MLVTDATLAGGDRRDVRVADGRVAAVEASLEPDDGERVVDADGALLLPGAVDVHVHFREPGFPHKETWTTGSRSAAAGGVTCVVDQPNTDPPTTTGPAFDVKARHARASLVDYGLNGGVSPDWDPAVLDRPLFALGEVFLADSTGDMGIDADLFREALERAADAGVTVTVHAEDATLFDEGARERSDADAWSAYRTAEAEIAAVERALDVAADVGASIHVAHTSTPEAVDLVAETPGATCEVTPHHLLLSRDDLSELGTFGRMNPPLRSAERRAALYERLVDGAVDVVATDHAPHTREEKDAAIWEAPSGVPGVETMVPLLLARARDPSDPLTVERLRDAVARRPAERFDLPGKGRVEPGADADLALYPAGARPVEGADLHSKCGWTPFEGQPGCFPAWTLLRGDPVYDPGGRFGDGTPTAPFGSPVGTNVRTER
ncbi:MAG: dihydroorotase [Haloferacaceae archaeon]